MWTYLCPPVALLVDTAAIVEEGALCGATGERTCTQAPYIPKLMIG